MAVRPIDGNELLKKFAYSPADTEDEQVFNAAARKIIQEAPTLTPPNDPLTIEELREMGGQPVYMPDTNCWALVTQNAFCPILTFPDGEKCSVYDWYEQVGPVYRRPPEGEEDT